MLKHQNCRSGEILTYFFTLNTQIIEFHESFDAFFSTSDENLVVQHTLWPLGRDKCTLQDIDSH